MNDAQRGELRQKIIRFCRKPKTKDEVAKKFSISGISAANFLSDLWIKDICILNRKNHSYKTRKRFLK